MKRFYLFNKADSRSNVFCFFYCAQYNLKKMRKLYATLLLFLIGLMASNFVVASNFDIDHLVFIDKSLSDISLLENSIDLASTVVEVDMVTEIITNPTVSDISNLEDNDGWLLVQKVKGVEIYTKKVCCGTIKSLIIRIANTNRKEVSCEVTFIPKIPTVSSCSEVHELGVGQVKEGACLGDYLVFPDLEYSEFELDVVVSI